MSITLTLKTKRICKKQHCGNVVRDARQVYCSRDHAPLGWYGIEDEKCHPLKKELDFKTPQWVRDWREKQKKVDKHL